MIDKAIDSNGQIILKRKSIYLQSMDASEDKRFKRIKIENGEIRVFRHNKNYQKQFVEIYNFCGKYKGKRIWKDGDFYKKTP